MTDKLRVVIDPNVLASVLIGGQTRHQFAELVRVADLIDVCYADELVAEVKALPQHRYFQVNGITESAVSDFLNLFIGFSLKIFITSTVKVGRDKNDFYLLSLCRDARASYLLTGDPDLLILGSYGQTQIIRLTDFMSVLPNLLAR